ncbi:MAG: indolepyruvate oxidoreductase subunit beta [Christensenellales bacterium]|jgi:indolepyruvate ferredoxin oxidoreductase beta subunit
MKAINMLIVGVGGQGTVLASRILGQLGLELGYDVKISEVHGMAQRGGSVVTHVRLGEKVYSPLVDKGGADIIIAFEMLEALRWKPYLKKGGSIFVNTQRINPMPVLLGSVTYPNDIASKLEQDAKVFSIDALDIATRCGSSKAVNVVLLGALAATLEIDKKIWLNTIKALVPKRFTDMNIAAFEGGYANTKQV